MEKLGRFMWYEVGYRDIIIPEYDRITWELIEQEISTQFSVLK